MLLPRGRGGAHAAISGIAWMGLPASYSTQCILPAQAGFPVVSLEKKQTMARLWQQRSHSLTHGLQNFSQFFLKIVQGLPRQVIAELDRMLYRNAQRQTNLLKAIDAHISPVTHHQK